MGKVIVSTQMTLDGVIGSRSRLLRRDASDAHPRMVGGGTVVDEMDVRPGVVQGEYREVEPLQGRHREPGRASIGRLPRPALEPYVAGSMFALRRKRLSGSSRAFRAASRV
jgi:hypothetical protein